MPAYTVRVQLHQGEPIDYTELHQAMEDVGLFRYIQSDDGYWYDLPNAEYHGILSNRSVVQVRELVRAIVERTNPPGGLVLVTEVVSSAWVLRQCDP